MEGQKQARQNALTFEEQRIRTAQEKTKQIVEEIMAPVRAAENALNTSTNQLDAFNRDPEAYRRETERMATEAGKEAVKALEARWATEGKEAAAAVAKQILSSGVGNIIPTALLQRTDNSATVIKMRELLGKRLKEAPDRDLLTRLAERSKELGIASGAVSAPTTPAAPKS
jgi:hypothetical protein